MIYWWFSLHPLPTKDTDLDEDVEISAGREDVSLPPNFSVGSYKFA